MEFFRHAVIQAHKPSKVQNLLIHPSRNLLYSIADDKRVAISDIESRRRVYALKCSNFRPKCMILVEETSQLYISMREAILFVFDISEIEPIVMHTVKINHMICSMTFNFQANCLMMLDVKGTLF